jgi:hypothetical protein
MTFEKNVFVNCPFDEAYLSLLRPILFVILDLGLTPRIALESLNSGKARIEKIIRLIEESKYAIHDLSRLRASNTMGPIGMAVRPAVGGTAGFASGGAAVGRLAAMTVAGCRLGDRDR